MESYQVFFVTGLSLLESNHNRHELFLGFHMFIYMNDKVRIFREGHKILQNLHRRFVLCDACQITMEISQNFVAFSEYMNFLSLTLPISFN